MNMGLTGLDLEGLSILVVFFSKTVTSKIFRMQSSADAQML
jgi:hypothetical protein